QPANGQRLGALRADFHRNLIGGAADTARADLNARTHVVELRMEHFHRLALQAGLDGVKGTVQDALGNRLLALLHDAVHELGQHDIPVLGIGENFALFGTTTTSHRSNSFFRPLGAVLGPALAPILDALGVEDATQDVIAHARQVLHTTAANEHHRVLLQVVTLTGDVADDFKTIGQTHFGDLAKRRVRLL